MKALRQLIIEIIFENDSVLIDHKWYVVSNVDSDIIETIDVLHFHGLG